MTTTQVQGPAIHVQGLEKSYKQLHVLRGVNFDIARGSVFALLGSNGAGKTTVVKNLSSPRRLAVRSPIGGASSRFCDLLREPAPSRSSKPIERWR
jgi:ABC-2 type transport system ATP-binding protein